MTTSHNNPPDPSHPDASHSADGSENAATQQSPSRSPVRIGAFHSPAVLNVLLCLTLALFIAQTFLLDRRTTRISGSENHLDQITNALSQTKFAYDPDLLLRGRTKSPDLDTLFQNQAVDAWRKLTHIKTTRAHALRRLGILLALFHKPGALDALYQAAAVRDPVKASKRDKHAPLDPLEVGPVRVSTDREIACWSAIYGRAKLSPSEAPYLRLTLAQLKLGWFENVAAAQLYLRSGMRAQAEHAARDADGSARWMRQLFDLDILILGGGILILSFLFVLTFAHGLQQFVGASPSSDLPALFPKNAPPLASYSYSALLSAFLAYLLCQETLGIVVALLLSPFHSRIEALPILLMLRLELGLQLLLYIPIVCLPLLILRRRIAFDPTTGRAITLRKMLEQIGFRVQSFPQELFAGLLGYLAVMPLIQAASILSSLLFSRFHTPNNPADLWMSAAQTPLDRILILLVASVGAPFAEELMFRGILYSALRSRLGVWGGAALSAAIFSAVHPTLPGGFLPIMAVGFGLALVYEWRRSLLPGMILHGVFNGLITLMAFAAFSR